jgi:anti-sigma-K factor RskA
VGRSAEFNVTCDQRQDSIFLYAADQLDAAEAEELRRHLSTGCPICEGALAEARATLAQMSLALDPVEPRAQTGDALMARIGASRLAPASTRGEHATDPAKTRGLNDQEEIRRGRMRIFSTAILSAAAAIAITSAIFVYATRMPRQFFGSANLQTVAMSSPVQAQARGQVLWDRDHNAWHVAVFNLAPPPAGKEYELWFLRAGNKAPMPSKTFTVDENGRQTLIVEVPPTSDVIVGAAVTIENAGGSTTPTMPIQLVGQLPG